MKLIKLIIALLICSTSFGQITNITGGNPKIRTSLITVTSDTLLVIIGQDIYKMAIADLPSSGGGGSGGGDVYKSGTPTANQVALWVNDSTIKGIDTATLFAGLRTNEIALKANINNTTLTGTLAAAAATFSGSVTLSTIGLGQIPYAGTAGLMSGTNKLYYFAAQNQLIIDGGSNTTATLNVTRNLSGTYPHIAITSTAGTLTDGYITFGDGVSSGYMPRSIYAGDNSTGTNTFHEYRVVDGASSIGANFNVTNQAGSAALANATAKLYQWQSNGTALMTVDVAGKLGIGTTTPAASSLLDVSSTTKGFLPPRMTGTQAEAIASPAEGLLIYSTDGSGSVITSKGWWGYDGSAWVKLN